MKKFVQVSMLPPWVVHKFSLKPGEEMTTKQMLQGIAIGSGNDASVLWQRELQDQKKRLLK